MMIITLRYASDPNQKLTKRYHAFCHHIKQKGLDAFFDLPVIGAIGIVTLIIVFVSMSVMPTNLLATLAIIFLFTLTLKSRWPFMIASFAVILFSPPGYNWHVGKDAKIIERDRNFFGVIRIVDFTTGERAFLHGTTNHGPSLLIKNIE